MDGTKETELSIRNQDTGTPIQSLREARPTYGQGFVSGDVTQWGSNVLTRPRRNYLHHEKAQIRYYKHPTRKSPYTPQGHTPAERSAA